MCSSDLFIDLQDEVGFAGDRGLLAIALDPNFNTNHYLYMAYTVDPEFGPPEESADEPAFARLVRYTGTSASNGNIADPASRTILIGDAPNTGFPVCNSTHTIGSLRWGLDGSLFLSVGDGAVWQGADQGGITPDCLQYEQPGNDIGAFRAQMLDSINGKILRIDPATGLGLPSNPYYNGDPAAPRSKVWVYGLRNPFRFNVRPGSPSPGSLFIGDVGWSNFEEISSAHAGDNLGWPCYEGVNPSPEYPGFNPPVGGCNTIGSPGNPGTLRPPLIDFHHSNWNLSHPQGPTGQAAVGGVFQVGTNYPAPYRGGFFFGEYIQGWIKVIKADADDDMTDLMNFGDNGHGPVDFAIDPLTGDVCFVSLWDQRVVRIHSTVRAGDVNRDGFVNAGDLLEVINHWGPCSRCQADLNGNGVVNLGDLLEVINNWG